VLAFCEQVERSVVMIFGGIGHVSSVQNLY
jgi:hypothetical protein